MYDTAAAIVLAICSGVLIVSVLGRFWGRPAKAQPVRETAPAGRPSFWQRVAVEMDRAECSTKYGNLFQRLNGWPAAGALCSMPVAVWVIYAAVPTLSVPVLYAASVLTGAALGYYAFRPQPNLDVHVLLLHLLTGVLVWGFVTREARWREVGPAVGFMMAAMLFFQAAMRSRNKPASRWSRPAPQRVVMKRKPENVMALVSIGVLLVVGGATILGWIPNFGPVTGLPLIGVLPYVVARGQGYRVPPLRAPWFFLPIAPVAWLLRVIFGLVAYLLVLPVAEETKPATPEPEPEGGLGGLLLFLAGRMTPVLLLCSGQLLFWQAAHAIREQAVLPIHFYLAGAIVLHCLAVAPVGLEVKSTSLRKAAGELGDYLIGHGLVAVRAMARNFSVLSLLVLPLLASSVLSGAWRQSVWPWAYVVLIVTGMTAMRYDKPVETPTRETRAFRAAGGR